MSQIAQIICSQANAEHCDLFIYESQKDHFRLVGTTHQHEKIGVLKINSNTLMNDPHTIKLEYNGKLTGAIALRNPKNLPAIDNLLEELAFSLWWLDRFTELENTAERYHNMSQLTDAFYSYDDQDELKKEMVKVVAKILRADMVLFLEKISENYVFTAGFGIDRNQLLIESIPQSHPFISKIEKSDSGILNIKTQIDFASIPVKSLIAVPLRLQDRILGVLIAINKISEEGYRTRYSFDEFDLSTLHEVARRISLAYTRLEYQNNLKKEIEKLKSYTKRYEDMIKQQQLYLKKMDLVHNISNAMRASYDPNNVYKILLLGLTSGRGLGFNRALLLLRDRKTETLFGKIWLGPSSEEDITKIWREAERRAMSYGDFSQYLREEALMLDISNGLTKKIEGKMFHYKDHPVFERVVLRRKLIHITPPLAKSMGEAVKDLTNLLETEEFAVVPLIGKWDTIGVLILDNKFTGNPISEIDTEVLKIIADSAGLTIENATNYEELRKKTESLEQQKNMIDYLRKFSESILQNLTTAVIVIDRQGKVLECNKRVEQLLGLPKERVIGSAYTDFGEAFQDVFGVAMKVFERGETITLSRYRIETANGERFFDTKYSPLWDIAGSSMNGVIVTLEDVTDQYLLEQERKDKEKLALLGEMSARVAHELRNPITVIGGFLNRLKKNISDSQARERYLNILSNEVDNLQNIVSEILEFSRSARNIDESKFQINELIEEVAFFMQEKAARNKINLEFMLSPLQEVVADRNRIKRVLINLVQNAIEATPQGGRIILKSQQDQDRVLVSVFNTGEPISEENLRKIFVPFYTTKTYGTGLGLPICKKIIEDEHGGRIWAESKPEGTEFKFEIPIKREGE
ncbi:sensor histidine kinase [Pseudothermotoga sp.]|uniref:sensor histidine kinase n=1 Tax=Pseudothermotoga sp. TaxID=2033661 RepID=UPI000E9B2D43|nr:sensor histidine kinase [Pseudothermotoga sp.]HBJ80356.1 histidine kinase [Pseudothermotoga sp.]